MIDVLNLALPYFGLIFLGFACGRAKSIPDRGLAWMDFFIVYLSLPALFFRILTARSFLLPLFLERLLAYTLRLSRSGSICHRVYFKGSGQSRVPQLPFTATTRPWIIRSEKSWPGPGPV